MQETQNAHTEEKRKGIASFFDHYEIKDLFKRFVQLLIVVEVLIFLVCWVYQLGIDEVAVTGKPVDIPFPWRVYFLVAFSAPVAVTFLVGIVVVAFNSFVYGQRGEPIFKEEGLEGAAGKLARIANFCFQLPFLLTLLLLGALIGVAYNMSSIMEYLARFGEAAAKVVLVGLGCVLVAGTIFGVVRMILNYKLRKKDMEYEYKREVMDRLGIAIIDDKTMIDSQGKVVGPKQIDISSTGKNVLPPGASEDTSPGPKE
ncbi:MAG: hypothetical protein EOL86_08900 [Deltaproteobacteria bacterium]|nr:hypothetical protein [Deltaproteobacteria bacterium]